jgi:hypothetical protein
MFIGSSFYQPLRTSVSIFFCLLGMLNSGKSVAQTSTTNDRITAANSPAEKSSLPSIDVAKDRARLMSSIYLATLDVMHDRYFHGERAVLPARAMEDVFAEIRRQSKAEARWISASLKPMSITHEPKTAFEKKAAKEIDEGKAEVEWTEDGFYRLATPVLLGSNCVNCHGGMFKEPSKRPKYAGLIISIPVDANSAKP